MRAAPAVSAPLDDCRPERVLIALVYGISGAALAGWGVAQGSAGGEQVGPLLGLAAGFWLGLKLARHLLPGQISRLQWDGQAWSVQRHAATGQPETMLLAGLQGVFDLGPWLLLRASDGAGRQHWLVLRERYVGAGWHLLRVALAAHSRGRP